MTTTSIHTSNIRFRPGARVTVFLGRLPMLLAFGLVWEVVAHLIRSPYLPGISGILFRFGSDWFSGPWYRIFLSDLAFDNAVPTVGRLGAGWAIGSVIGVLIGSVIAVSPRCGWILEPIVRLGMSVPAPALLPLTLALFGLDTGGKIFFIAFGAIWPVIVNTAGGMRNADVLALASSRSLVLHPLTWFLRVRVPLASPQIMAGLRISVNAAVLLIIVSELYAATSGIGFVIVATQRDFDFVGTWSGVLALALLGIGCNGLFALAEKQVMRWHHTSKEVYQ